jgi:hypothetical protein
MCIKKVRMQADSMKDAASRRGYKNVFDALIRVFKEEGFANLYSGLSSNILRGMSVNAGMLACYDQVRPSSLFFSFLPPIIPSYLSYNARQRNSSAKTWWTMPVWTVRPCPHSWWPRWFLDSARPFALFLSISSNQDYVRILKWLFAIDFIIFR